MKKAFFPFLQPHFYALPALMNRALQRLQQAALPNVGVGIMNKNAGIRIAVGIDVEIALAACNAAAHYHNGPVQCAGIVCRAPWLFLIFILSA